MLMEKTLRYQIGIWLYFSLIFNILIIDILYRIKTIMGVSMAFSEQEYNQLLALKFVGAKIIERLEQMELDSFAKLRDTSLEEILNKGALLTGSSCWKNSHQAKTAILNILTLVKQS